MIFTALHFVQRRAGDVDVSPFHKLPLVAIEERENQRANVGTIHISISHDHDAVIPQIFHIELFTLDAQAEGRDQGLNLGVLVNLGVIGFLNIQNLAPQRQDRLVAAITPLLGGATCGVTLNDINL